MLWTSLMIIMRSKRTVLSMVVVMVMMMLLVVKKVFWSHEMLYLSKPPKTSMPSSPPAPTNMYYHNNNKPPKTSTPSPATIQSVLSRLPSTNLLLLLLLSLSCCLFVVVESTWRPLKQPLYQPTNHSVLFLLLLLLLYLLLTMSIDLYALFGNTRPGLFSSSLRIRNWTYRTSCKGRPGPHAVAVQALRTSSANQLHYALPCEKLRGILCSCPLNTDRILALKNTLKGARLIGGFG